MSASSPLDPQTEGRLIGIESRLASLALQCGEIRDRLASFATMDNLRRTVDALKDNALGYRSWKDVYTALSEIEQQQQRASGADQTTDGVAEPRHPVSVDGVRDAAKSVTPSTSSEAGCAVSWHDWIEARRELLSRQDRLARAEALLREWWKWRMLGTSQAPPPTADTKAFLSAYDAARTNTAGVCPTCCGDGNFEGPSGDVGCPDCHGKGTNTAGEQGEAKHG